MREKARFVLAAMEQRMAALGFGWADVTATQVYTVFDILGEESNCRPSARQHRDAPNRRGPLAPWNGSPNRKN
jgi:hypothetical protein